MANYIAITRSNYFRVKDAQAFEAWCHKLGVEFWTRGAQDEAFYAITGVKHNGGWPSFQPDTDVEIAFATELAAHLDPRDVAILFEIGWEKLRYVVGVATALHADGSTVSISLDDIYAEAVREFGSDLNITEGSY
jgi:hypothetical protein